MADDMDDDIEDLLEAPYKNVQPAPPFKDVNIDKLKKEDNNQNGNGNHSNDDHCSDNSDHDDRRKRKTNGGGGGEEEEEEDSKESKKSRKDRSRSRDRHHHHHHKSRHRSSRSRSRSKNKKSRRSSRSRSRSRGKRSSHSRRSYRSRTRSPARQRPRRQRTPELTPEERDARTVFCMQLAARIRPRDLEDFFSSVGKVRDVRLITDPRTKRSKGIAYIEFRDVDAVSLAIALTGQRLLGVPIIVKLTQAEKNRMPLALPSSASVVIPQSGAMKLYIGSLHVNITEEMLREIFAPFGTIDIISLAKDDFQRSKGYGYIQFANAEDAKKAMEQLNNFELANRPIKVTPYIDKTQTVANINSINATNTNAEQQLSLDNGISHLDNDELERTGVNLGPSGKLALMAKLAESSGLKVPQYTLDAIHANTNKPTSEQQQKINEDTAGATQCFILSNMFDLEEEKKKPNWVQEMKDDVIDECQKCGGLVHIHIDEECAEGNIYIKCATVTIAMTTMAGLNGRYFAGKMIRASFIPLHIYHSQFPKSIRATKILESSSSTSTT